MFSIPSARSHLISGGALVLTLALGLGAAAGSLAGGSQDACFFLRSWDGQWKVSPDSRSLYVRQSGQVFRIDLQQPAPLLQSSFAVLNTRGSSDAVCAPQDLHLVVSDRLGSLQPAIVSKITRLTPDELAALPKQLRPR
jgi:hypothetical protein